MEYKVQLYINNKDKPYNVVIANKTPVFFNISEISTLYHMLDILDKYQKRILPEVITIYDENKKVYANIYPNIKENKIWKIDINNEYKRVVYVPKIYQHSDNNTSGYNITDLEKAIQSEVHKSIYPPRIQYIMTLYGTNVKASLFLLCIEEKYWPKYRIGMNISDGHNSGKITRLRDNELQYWITAYENNNPIEYYYDIESNKSNVTDMNEKYVIESGYLNY